MSDSLWPHGLQHARLPCPSLFPRVCSNSCPLSWWCHPTISSSVVPFSSCPQSFPAWGSFLSGGQNTEASASTSVLSMNIQGWFPLGLIGFYLLVVQGTLKSLLQHHSSKASILQCSAFFMVQLSHPYMAIRETIALIIWTFVSKVMSLLFNMLSSKEQVSFNFMGAVTVHSDLGAQEKKICHCFHFFPIYWPWRDGTRYHDLGLWMLNFKPHFSLSSFTMMKRLFISSSLSAYLRLLIFLPAILIPACTSSRPAFHMMYSALKLNKQDDNIQCTPWRTPFPILNQTVVPCPVLTVAFWPAYIFLRRQVRWSSIPISLSIFQLVVNLTVKSFTVVNETEVDVFFWNSLVFSVIQRMLAIWSLVPLPFLNPACTSGSSQFM